MTVTTFVSIKGAPGVTTLACLVGATWPDERRVSVVEADPFGGDLAARFQLSSAWGWSSYTTAVRRSEGVVPIEPHLQSLPGGLEVMVLPAGGRCLVATGSVEALLRSSGSSEPGSRDLVVDGGRLTDLGTRSGTTSDPAASTGIWLDRSDRVVVVTRRDPASVVKVRERADALRQRCGDRVGLVVVGRGPHDTDAIEEFTGISVIGIVPYDPSAAQVAAGERGGGRHLSRSLLVASARRLALALSGAGAGAGGAGTGGAADPSGMTSGVTGLQAGQGRGAVIRAARFLGNLRRPAVDGRASSGADGSPPPTEPPAAATIAGPMAMPMPMPMPDPDADPDPTSELAPDGRPPQEPANGGGQAVLG